MPTMPRMLRLGFLVFKFLVGAVVFGVVKIYLKFPSDLSILYSIIGFLCLSFIEFAFDCHYFHENLDAISKSVNGFVEQFKILKSMLLIDEHSRESYFQRAKNELLSTIESLSQRKYKLYTSSRIWTEDALILKDLGARNRKARHRPHVQAAIVVPNDPDLLLDDPEFKIYTDAQKAAETVNIEKIYVFESRQAYDAPVVRDHLNALSTGPGLGRIGIKIIILGDKNERTQHLLKTMEYRDIIFFDNLIVSYGKVKEKYSEVREAWYSCDSNDFERFRREWALLDQNSTRYDQTSTG